MAMTPAQARALAKPIADIYAQLTDDLMTSIAAQLGKGIEVSGTAKWQLNKLAQLGELNARNVRLIAKRTKRCPELHYQAVISAAGQALDETDKLYQLALAAAELGKPVDFPASDAMMSALQLYQDQAKDLYNLVNTTMAYKARDAYTGHRQHGCRRGRPRRIPPNHRSVHGIRDHGHPAAPGGAAAMPDGVCGQGDAGICG